MMMIPMLIKYLRVHFYRLLGGGCENEKNKKSFSPKGSYFEKIPKNQHCLILLSMPLRMVSD